MSLLFHFLKVVQLWYVITMLTVFINTATLLSGWIFTKAITISWVLCLFSVSQMKKLRLSEVWCPAQKTSQLVRSTARNTTGLAKMFVWIFPWDLTYSKNVLTFVYLYLQIVSQDSFSEVEILGQRCNLCSFYTVLMKVKVLVIHSCLTLCDLMDGSPLDSSVHGILLARILEWVAIPFSTASSQPRDQTWVSCIAGGFFTLWATREALYRLLKTHPILEVGSGSKSRCSRRSSSSSLHTHRGVFLCFTSFSFSLGLPSPLRAGESGKFFCLPRSSVSYSISFPASLCASWTLSNNRVPLVSGIVVNTIFPISLYSDKWNQAQDQRSIHLCFILASFCSCDDFILLVFGLWCAH